MGKQKSKRKTLKFEKGDATPLKVAKLTNVKLAFMTDVEVVFNEDGSCDVYPTSEFEGELICIKDCKIKGSPTRLNTYWDYCKYQNNQKNDQNDDQN